MATPSRFVTEKELEEARKAREAAGITEQPYDPESASVFSSCPFLARSLSHCDHRAAVGTSSRKTRGRSGCSTSTLCA